MTDDSTPWALGLTVAGFVAAVTAAAVVVLSLGLTRVHQLLAVGLNLVEGTPRALGLDESRALARLARSAGVRTGQRLVVVAVTADPTAERLEAILRAMDPDVVQLSGAEPPARVAEYRAAGADQVVIRLLGADDEQAWQRRLAEALIR